MSSDAWEEIQAVKSKRNSLREKLEKRKKERQNILGATLGVTEKGEGTPGGVKQERSESSPASQKNESSTSLENPKLAPSVSLEVQLLQVLSDMQLQLPATAGGLLPGLGDVSTRIVASLLQKFATQKLITIRERTESGNDSGLEVVSAESVRLAAVLAALIEEQSTSIKRKGTIGFDKATTIRLIQEYERHRLLWDLKDKYHFNKRRKEDAWLEIAMSLEINVEDAKRKMSSLLGSFRREKSKGTKFVETSNGTLEVYKSDWFALKSFAFLIDKNHSSETMKSEQENNSHQGLVEVEINQTSSSSSLQEHHYEASTAQSTDSDSAQNYTTKPLVKPSKPNKKRAKKTAKVDESNGRLIDMAYQFLQQPIEQEDSTTKYAKYLAEKLNQFDQKTKAILIHNFNTLIFEAEMSLYSNT